MHKANCWLSNRVCYWLQDFDAEWCELRFEKKSNSNGVFSQQSDADKIMDENITGQNLATATSYFGDDELVAYY